MKSPKVLYHASTNKSIEVFEPRQESTRDKSEGPVVFATPDAAYASCFLVKTDSSWVNISRWGDNNPWAFVCADEDRFRQLDEGGSIYSLPPDTFTTDPNKGTGLAEWVSRENIKPLEQLEYKSGLEAMLNQGVQVFFINNELFQLIEESTDHGLSLLLELQSQGKSVNQVRNINAIPLIESI